MISVIIPVLNEAKTIGSLLQHLMENSDSMNISDIIVVDGGSTDGTQKIVTNFIASSDFEHSEKLNQEAQKSDFTQADILLLNSPKGRAKQMNLGAKNAKGDILYFLHADSFPPKHFDHYIINEVKKGHEAGCFRMQFDSSHWWLQLAGWLTQFNLKACRGGDQSLFITKSLFNIIGGYDETYIIYEDNILIKELYKRNQFTVINKKIITSARLYKRVGIWKLQIHYWAIHLKKWLGASAEDLLAYYKRYIA